MDNLELEKNPELFADRLSEQDLQLLIEKYNDLYYNEGNSGISDNTYDALIYVLNKKIRNDKTKSHNQLIIGAPPKSKMKVDLPFYMPSLNKVKAGTNLTSFLSVNSRITGSVKLDGVSAMVVYEDGIATAVYLRGNGTVGTDVSYVINYLDFPQLINISDMVVRGEFVIAKSTWNKKYSSNPKSGAYGTARNFVCGKLNAGHLTQGLEDLVFVAFDIVHLSDNILPSPSECFQILEDEGFKVAKHFTVNSMLVADVVATYTKEFEEHIYPIDGIVLAYDEARFVADKLENPNHTVAFKMNLETQIRTTKVTGIDWSITRTGRVFPTIEYETVYIDGRKLHRATGHNAKKTIQEWKLCIGTTIKVTASGGVIPQIVDVLPSENDLKDTPTPIMPPATIPPWKWEGADIVLLDIEGCEEVHLKRQIHFLDTLNIPNIREARLRAMHQDIMPTKPYQSIIPGLKTLAEILNADQARLQLVPGIGPKISAKFREGITSVIPKAKLYRLMRASCCFPKGMGKIYLRDIATRIPTFLLEDPKVLPAKIRAPGIGPKRIQMFMEGLPKFKEFVKGFPDVTKNNKAYFDDLAKNGFNSKINGKNFVFTVLEDNDLEDYILDHRGTMQKAVGSTTTAVITGNVLDITTKTRDALSNGIKVYTVVEFKRIFNITY